LERVSDNDQEEWRGCGLCGKSLESEADRQQGLYVEITRTDAQGNPSWLDEVFCSQSHAAEWFTRPLPPIEATNSAPAEGWKSRAMGALVVLCFVWALGLMLLGSYAFVRLLGGWD
jgi:hypothetical protein